MTELKLDLGCGKNKREGFLGVDRRKYDNVDIVADLVTKNGVWLFDTSAFPKNDIKLEDALVDTDGGFMYKLPENSVDELHCSHFLEHLHHNADKPQRVRFMNECYRVLKPGGKIQIITPHWCSNRAYGDFTHADKPVSEMFYYYLSKQWRAVNAPDNDIQWNPDGYTCDFAATWAYTVHPELNNKNTDMQNFALVNYKEAAQDIIANLVAKK
jgi:SAM-dependent methyltransferase